MLYTLATTFFLAVAAAEAVQPTPATATPPSPTCPGAIFNTAAPFKLVAYPANATGKYNPTDYLQLYSNTDNGMGPQQLFSFAGGVPDYQASNFTFNNNTNRLITRIQNQTGTYTYKSIAPTVNYPLNLTQHQTDFTGDIFLAIKGPCHPKGAPGQDLFFTDGIVDTSNRLYPWFLCQVPGFTTGLKNIIYARGVTKVPQSCSRVALKPVPATD